MRYCNRVKCNILLPNTTTLRTEAAIPWTSRVVNLSDLSALCRH